MTSSDNVDPAEIQKFEDIARRWWDENSEFKPLHQINPLRMRYISESASLKGKKTLDIGCGGGIVATLNAGVGVPSANTLITAL